MFVSYNKPKCKVPIMCSQSPRLNIPSIHPSICLPINQSIVTLRLLVTSCFPCCHGSPQVFVFPRGEWSLPLCLAIQNIYFVLLAIPKRSLNWLLVCVCTLVHVSLCVLIRLVHQLSTFRWVLILTIQHT